MKLSSLDYSVGASVLVHALIASVVYLASDGGGNVVVPVPLDADGVVEITVLPGEVAAGGDRLSAVAESAAPVPVESVVPAAPAEPRQEADVTPTTSAVVPEVLTVPTVAVALPQGGSTPGISPMDRDNAGAGQAPSGGIGSDGPGTCAGYLTTFKPAYPAAARKRGQEGLVLLRILVLADGLPAEVELEQSSGFTLLDAAAREAVKQWRFIPARKGNAPVASRVEVPVVFRLSPSQGQERRRVVASAETGRSFANGVSTP